jgi:hypothetical protein
MAIYVYEIDILDSLIQLGVERGGGKVIIMIHKKKTSIPDRTRPRGPEPILPHTLSGTPVQEQKGVP